jgi:hypothetical protein
MGSKKKGKKKGGIKEGKVKGPPKKLREDMTEEEIQAVNLLHLLYWLVCSLLSALCSLLSAVSYLLENLIRFARCSFFFGLRKANGSPKEAREDMRDEILQLAILSSL